ncbi:MAG: 30S ribosomal protein S8 [Candidatus Eisenbacteria bacterium]|nr:30S ribosomal protein S8 [Candidatus Eisenbacteria bacterium]
MSMSDPVADFLTRIRNANKAKHKRVDIPRSKLKLEIAKALLREKYIARYKMVEDDRHGMLRLYLRYTPTGDGIITDLKRVSRPGLRQYVGKDEIPRVFNGIGTAIISTSSGVLTSKEARRAGVGGEVLCYIW